MDQTLYKYDSISFLGSRSLFRWLIWFGLMCFVCCDFFCNEVKCSCKHDDWFLESIDVPARKCIIEGTAWGSWPGAWHILTPWDYSRWWTMGFDSYYFNAMNASWICWCMPRINNITLNKSCHNILKKSPTLSLLSVHVNGFTIWSRGYSSTK